MSVYVSNDGATWARSTTPALFTYYDSTGFSDPPLFVPWDAGYPGDDDLVSFGNYTGDGQSLFEVSIDGVAPDTFRWRRHLGSAVVDATPWAAALVPINNTLLPPPLNLTTGLPIAGDYPPPWLLDFGVYVNFTLGGTGRHGWGDAWLIRHVSGRPYVAAVTTTHFEAAFAARGPFEGNTEITLTGNNFYPSARGLYCALWDELTRVLVTVPAQYDTPSQVRCIVPRLLPLPGGCVLGTIRPCYYKTVQATADGGVSWSRWATAPAYFVCDIYVSPDGSDAFGVGTPDLPYRTIQKAIESALAEPRSYYRYKDTRLTGVEVRGPSTFPALHYGVQRPQPVVRGFGYNLNRDRILVRNGLYAGAGNTNLAPMGKMLEVVGESSGGAAIDCGGSGVAAVLASGSRSSGEEMNNLGVINLVNVATSNCDGRRLYG